MRKIGCTVKRPSMCSEFQWTVLCAARRIKSGRVTTYKGLARLIGTKSARAVGNALARNPFPLAIPCHRVVGFDRKIGGFRWGKNVKRLLLCSEGVKFDEKDRILKSFFLKNSF